MKKKTPTKKSESGDHLTLDSSSGMSDPLSFPQLRNLQTIPSFSYRHFHRLLVG